MSCPKIAVIGAGISGVAAAHELIKHGQTNVTIYEALDRIGGRICTHYESPDDSPSYRLELGANWIHGTHGNPVFELAKAKGLLDQPKDRPKFQRYDWVNLTIDGDKIAPSLFRDVSKWYSKEMDKCDAVFASNPSPNTDRSVESAFREAFPEFLQQRPVKEHEVCEQILNHRLDFETTLCGCDSMLQVSRNQNGSYVTFPGPDPEIPVGFIKAVECLAENIPKDNIKLNSTVQHICYDSALSENTGMIKIILESGEIEYFDHVIVTSSINYLKHHHQSLFRPALPIVKQEALSRTAMGTVDKIFLQFPDLKFLPSTWRIIRFVWPLDVDRSEWTSRIHCFSVMNTPRQDTLSVWLTGNGAEQMERLSNEDVMKGVTRVLSRLLRNQNLPQPVRIIRTRWGSEPSILGSYSYIPVGGSVQDIQELAKPITHHNSERPVVQFAGEGTHPKYYSTTHGALLSGQREAHVLLQYYGNQ